MSRQARALRQLTNIIITDDKEKWKRKEKEGR